VELHSKFRSPKHTPYNLENRYTHNKSDHICHTIRVYKGVVIAWKIATK